MRLRLLLHRMCLRRLLLLRRLCHRLCLSHHLAHAGEGGEEVYQCTGVLWELKAVETLGAYPRARPLAIYRAWALAISLLPRSVAEKLWDVRWARTLSNFLEVSMHLPHPGPGIFCHSGVFFFRAFAVITLPKMAQMTQK